MPATKHRQPWFLVPALVVGLTGCGGGPEFPHATIHGVVTLDGKPIEDGKITYFPLAATGAGSGGSAPITRGKYELFDVPIGGVCFTFSALIETGRTVEDLGKQVPEQINPIPVAYREEGVTREIKSSGEQNFELIGNSKTSAPQG